MGKELKRIPNKHGHICSGLFSTPSPSELDVFFFWLKAATQLARRVQPKRTQVVCSNKVGRNRLAESNGTPAMDPGHRNIDLT